VTPAAKRKAVAHLVDTHGMSERRARKAIGCCRMTMTYVQGEPGGRSSAPGKSIYRLEPTSVQKLDQNWLRLGNQSALGWYAAHKYWSGDATANPKWEHVLAPPVKVVAKVD
jgi:hypothetical protein